MLGGQGRPRVAPALHPTAGLAKALTRGCAMCAGPRAGICVAREVNTLVASDGQGEGASSPQQRSARLVSACKAHVRADPVR